VSKASSPPPKQLKLAERDKHMSEQKQPSNFMQELDRWTDANIIYPLRTVDDLNQEDWEETVAQIKKAVRIKVLQSFRNGQKTGLRPEGFSKIEASDFSIQRQGMDIQVREVSAFADAQKPSN
jgi:hypothetical protein